MVPAMLLLAQLGAGEVVQHASVDGVELDVAASSMLVEKNRPPLRYGPANLVDADPGTIWAEGVAGSGEGEWIELRFAAPTAILGFEVMNGHGASSRLYEANASVPAYEVRLDGERYRDRSLAGAEWAWGSDVDARLYWLAKPALVRTLRLTILTARKGLKYEDTCLGTFRPILAGASETTAVPGDDAVTVLHRFAHASPGERRGLLAASGISYSWTTRRKVGAQVVAEDPEYVEEPGPPSPRSDARLQRVADALRAAIDGQGEQTMLLSRKGEEVWVWFRSSPTTSAAITWTRAGGAGWKLRSFHFTEP